tara:strand:+ start:122 stop:898 length:777 start_codon:yes stop_codon:yes gene_type:complete
LNIRKKIKIKPTVLFTKHAINQAFSYRFAKGSGLDLCNVEDFNSFNKPIAAYGYKRGTGEAIKKSNDFWYLDHGYFKQSSRNFINNRVTLNSPDGYFRIVHNNFWDSGKGDHKADRLKKLNLNFNENKNKGSYIIISEPTEYALNYYDLHNWTEKTIKKISKISDRKILIHNRGSKIPLKVLLKDAWAFVSDHSSAGFLSILEGVPAYFTNNVLSNIGCLEELEKGLINYQALNNLAYGQWNMAEIDSGEAWDFFYNT